MKIEVQGLKELKDKLGNYSRQLPFALSKALTETAKNIREAEYQEMKMVFDRPTRWTLNSLMVRPATKQDLTASVELKNADRLGDKHHLIPQILGGSRAKKNFERMLRNTGILPPYMFAVPARNAILDKHGNFPGQQMVQILSSLKVFGETGYQMNKSGTSRGKKKNRYFIMKRNDGRQFGIGERLGPKNYRVIMIFVSKAQYRRRLDFYKVAEHIAYAKLLKNMKEALTEALKTMRLGPGF